MIDPVMDGCTCGRSSECIVTVDDEGSSAGSFIDSFGADVSQGEKSMNSTTRDQMVEIGFTRHRYSIVGAFDMDMNNNVQL